MLKKKKIMPDLAMTILQYKVITQKLMNLNKNSTLNIFKFMNQKYYHLKIRYWILSLSIMKMT